MQLLHVLKSKNSPKGQVAGSTKTFAPSLKLMLLFHTETLLLDYPKYLKASLIEKSAKVLMITIIVYATHILHFGQSTGVDTDIRHMWL